MYNISESAYTHHPLLRQSAAMFFFLAVFVVVGNNLRKQNCTKATIQPNQTNDPIMIQVSLGEWSWSAMASAMLLPFPFCSNVLMCSLLCEIEKYFWQRCECVYCIYVRTYSVFLGFPPQNNYNSTNLLLHSILWLTELCCTRARPYIIAKVYSRNACLVNIMCTICFKFRDLKCPTCKDMY